MAESLPPHIMNIVTQLKAQGLEIDENDPQQVQQVLMALIQRQRPTPKFLDPEDCIPGSEHPIRGAPSPTTLHYTLRTPLHEPFPEKCHTIMFGMGCFWCSEDLFHRIEGVYSTQVGYAGGVTKNPTYEQVSSGKTNHNEVVRVVYDSTQEGLLFTLLKVFWETHDSTTPFRQGNDQGTQYRSGIYYTTPKQAELAQSTKAAYAEALKGKGIEDEICTEILEAPHFWMGEDYHQQYDAKPSSNGYCGLSPLGVPLPGP